MKSPLEQKQSLDEIILQLRNIDGKLDAGRIIRAYRENGKILSFFERTKSTIIQDNKKDLTITFSDDKTNPLVQMQDLEEVIRQLHKINSLIYSGQIVPASGSCNKLMASLRRKKLLLIEQENKEQGKDEKQLI